MSESIRDGYKMTEMGELPKEWENLRLGTIAFINRGFTWKKIQENQEHYDNTIPVIRISNIKKKLDTDDLIFLGGVSEKEMKKYRLSKNDIIMVGSNGNHDRIGNICIINEDMDYLFASFLIGIKVKNKNIFPHFLYYFLSLPINQKKITDSVTGTTGLGNLSLSFLDYYNIISPPLLEQHCIVEILSTIDETIERTEALIEKYRHIKAGLMSDLLTRGIDEEGRIRSDGTHRFKDSPLGRVPEEWDVTTLLNVVGDKNDLIIAGPFGSNLKVEDYRDEGIPIIRLQNIDFGKFLNKDIKCISPEKANELSYHSFIKGDIVLAKLGDPIGKTCIIPHFLKRGVVVSDVVRIRVDNAFTDKKFILQCLNSFYVFYQLNKDIIGTTRPRVNLDQVRNLFIPFPPLPEQHHIAEILTTTDTYIEKEQTYLNKLQQIKKGLMQDLLTGKVRVTTTSSPPKPAEAST